MGNEMLENDWFEQYVSRLFNHRVTWDTYEKMRQILPDVRVEENFDERIEYLKAQQRRIKRELKRYKRYKRKYKLESSEINAFIIEFLAVVTAVALILVMIYFFIFFLIKI